MDLLTTPNVVTRPVYFTEKFWDTKQNNYGCKLYKYLNKPVCFVPTKTKKKKKISERCSICWETIIIIDKWTKLSRGFSVVSENINSITLMCNHKFHNKCLNRWLEQSDTCPLCRRIV
jgi:hypothetical protein